MNGSGLHFGIANRREGSSLSAFCKVNKFISESAAAGH
jgi:hypothetical protein